MSRRWRWVAIGVAAGALAVAERLRPLHRRVEPGPRHVARNLVIGALAGLTTAASQAPLIAPVQEWAERRGVGLLRPLPPPVRAVAGFLLLDYTLYVWHWLNHHVPFLWRFHVVHHMDRDLDASSGLRFHFGEFALAAVYRAAQIAVIGADRRTFALWQRLVVATVVLQHSNLALPEGIDRRLRAWVVTPRMHVVHHSTRVEETNSNYSTVLSCWDVLHGSLRTAASPDAITIGLAGYLDPDRVTLARSLAQPFRSGTLEAFAG